MLSERSQTQKDNYCLILANSQTESRLEIARDWGRGHGELLFNGCRVSVWDGKERSGNG